MPSYANSQPPIALAPGDFTLYACGQGASESVTLSRASYHERID
jgi:hypothetical protein